jgi:hypothetical protein
VLSHVSVIDHAPANSFSGPSGEPILSVELPGAKVSLLFRHGDVDVVVSDVDACGRIPDTSVAGGFSWHFVIEGRALFEQGGVGWEVLPTHSLRLEGTPSYRVVNPAEDHLRLLSVVVGPTAVGESGGDR